MKTEDITKRLEEIRDREVAATSDPWCIGFSSLTLDVGFDGVGEGPQATLEDGIFINHARADIPFLVKVVEQLIEERGEIRKQMGSSSRSYQRHI